MYAHTHTNVWWLYMNIITVHQNSKVSIAQIHSKTNAMCICRFSTTPFWNRLRMISMIIFWVFWIGLFVAVIAITIAEGKLTYIQCTCIYAPPHLSFAMLLLVCYVICTLPSYTFHNVMLRIVTHIIKLFFFLSVQSCLPHYFRSLWWISGSAMVGIRFHVPGLRAKLQR